MRTVILFVISIVMAVGLWQCSELRQLRALEAQASAIASTSKPALPDKDETISGTSKPVSDAELAEFTKSVLAVQEEFETDLYSRLEYNQIAFPYPHLCEKLCRLSTEQIRIVYDTWRGSEPVAEGRSLGLFRFLLLAGRVNPSAIVPLTYELKRDGKLPLSYTPPFAEWFCADTAGFLKWAQQAGMPDGFESPDFYKPTASSADQTDTKAIFDSPCKIWADAAAVSLDPSPANMQRFISHKTSDARSAAYAIVQMLDTQERRLVFFRSLSEATGGIYDNCDYYCGALTQRVSFEQLAFVADSIPALRPSVAEREYKDGAKDQLVTFRFGIAAKSRDSTAARRWEWLNKREEDRPSDKQLGQLVDEWCKHDYPDTTRWIRNLPPGPLRDAATGKVVAFLEYHRRNDLVPEWKIDQWAPR